MFIFLKRIVDDHYNIRSQGDGPHKRWERLGVMVYCFDIDGTLCSQVNGNYELAEPYSERISAVNALFHAGNRIVLFTARGSKSGIDWAEATRVQVEKWGLRHHELIVGKPHADFYIDDKAVHPDDFEW